MREFFWILTIVGLVGYFLSLMNPAKLVALFAWMFFLAGLFFLAYVWASGRRARHTRNSGHERENIQTHRDHVSILSLIILLGVVAILIALKKHGGERQLSEVYWVHMMFVLGSIYFFFLARFAFTGIKNPASHRKFVYWFMVFYTNAFFTGSVLLNNRFQIF